ncbi:MAG: isoleucine--tRNA ligase [Acidimicrobiales bacterium]|nr:isoleucine--tRNA ligase [Acidimicrobiales bacterium]|tara:strand:- start:33 stop:3185 length:3153 start_codon:yes stop_codon:yes gene_type:complete
MTKERPYPHVGKADFPNLEEKVLDRWEKDNTFQVSVDSKPEESEYVFYDGPPFANGLPHHGHLLTGYVKDVVPRFQTMKGKKVERRFGWDCHGLPAEMEVEKELQVSGRSEITEYGIDKFNERCEESVLRFTEEWEKTVTRQARWVDFENDYKTMDPSYMESVMWAFKQLWEKDLIYEAFRVMPYSWGAETPLSNFEIRLDDATRPRQDPAVTVAFDLDTKENESEKVRLLAWTTTPWTLPSNLALAVGAEIEYSKLKDSDGTIWIISSNALSRYEEQLEDMEDLGTIRGSELIGKKYKPLFDFFDYRTDAFKVLEADWIDDQEGTGIVHMAPGFGEDDQTVCEANDISIGDVVPVDDKGCYTKEVKTWKGMNVFDANPEIISTLKSNGQLLRHDSYEHNYPHCWRTDTPIIYKAISSWYVKVTDLTEQLLANNQAINWIPGHVQNGRFGMWLEGARDWSISRNRFWGSPIPVWKSDNSDYPRVDVYGSIEEIEKDFGVKPDNLHRPFIDELTRPNPDDPTGKSFMHRVPEVLDCWFESGSMPFAQVHYPFENKEWFDDHFPADFIVEYINQTRGWFYTLHVLATALFDRPAFQNVICHGILLAEDGAKLSKKLRNYTEPNEIFVKQGSDALRWYLMSANIVRGGDSRISDNGIDDVVRHVLLPIWNAYSFFTLYANVDGYEAKFRTESEHLLDRYLLAKTRQLVESVDSKMEDYDLPGATESIQAFIDALNNWYIRRSRDRFWEKRTKENENEKKDAYDTLYTVLKIFSQVSAPFLPMIMEEIHTGLTGEQSVHLTDWPDSEILPEDKPLVENMDRIRDAASTALRLREDEGIRVRLPLSSMVIAGPGSSSLSNFLELLTDEVNVKEIKLIEDLDKYATYSLQPNGSLLGPRLGKEVQSVFAAAKSGDWELNEDGTAKVADVLLNAEEFELGLQPHEGITAATLNSGDAIIILDTEITEDLAKEGIARDVIRQVQQARRDAELVVTDRIQIWLDGGETILEGVKTFEEYVASQILATEIIYGRAENPDVSTTQVEIENSDLTFSIVVSQ